MFRSASFRPAALLLLLAATHSHAQWMKTSGPDSVRVLSTVNGATVYAGTASGVFLSQDSGATWAAGNAGLTNTSIRSILIRPGAVFVGTEGGGVFRSMNNAASWVAVNNGLTGLDIRALVFSGNHLVAGTNNGIFRSADNGANWSAFNLGLTHLDVRALVGIQTGVPSSIGLYAGTSGGGVFRLAAGDSSWRPQNDSLANLDIRALANDGPYLFAGTTIGAYRWQAQHLPPRWTRLAEVPDVGIHSIAGVISSAAHQNEWVLAGTAGAGVFLLKGSGTGLAINEGLTDLHVHAVSPYENFGGGFLFAGTTSGVWRHRKANVIPPGSGSIKRKTESPLQFNLGYSVLSFSLPAPARVTLTAHSLSGERISLLLDEHLPSGAYERPFNGSTLPPGLYVYRLQAGEISETRKILLTH